MLFAYTSNILLLYGKALPVTIILKWNNAPYDCINSFRPISLSNFSTPLQALLHLSFIRSSKADKEAQNKKTSIDR